MYCLSTLSIRNNLFIVSNALMQLQTQHALLVDHNAKYLRSRWSAGHGSTRRTNHGPRLEKLWFTELYTTCSELEAADYSSGVVAAIVVALGASVGMTVGVFLGRRVGVGYAVGARFSSFFISSAGTLVGISTGWGIVPNASLFWHPLNSVNMMMKMRR